MAHVDWRRWVIGLVGAAVNSAATAITLVIVDPQDFWEWDRLAKVMLVMGLVGAALFLKEHPMPEVDDDGLA